MGNQESSDKQVPTSAEERPGVSSMGCDTANRVDFSSAILTPPTDEDGFVVTFHPDRNSVAEIREFFDHYGFVVFGDLLPPPTLEQVVAEVWRLIAEALGISVSEAIDLIHDHDKLADSQLNWSNVFGAMERLGFLRGEPASPLLEVRQCPELHRAYSILMRRRDLRVKLDRFGFMRPTRLSLHDGSVRHMDHWKTSSNWIHWDQNPWKEPNFSRIQGLLALSEHTWTSGGFHCLPGFHKIMTAWTSTQAPRGGDTVQLRDEALRQHAKVITMRRGSYVCWDSRLPHANWPNNDGSFRMVLYQTFYPAPVQEDEQYRQSMDGLLASPQFSVIAPLHAPEPSTAAAAVTPAEAATASAVAAEAEVSAADVRASTASHAVDQSVLSPLGRMILGLTPYPENWRPENDTDDVCKDWSVDYMDVDAVFSRRQNQLFLDKY